jgi:hypothetical protein
MKLAYAIGLAALTFAVPADAKAPPAEGWTMADKGDEVDHWIRDKDWLAGRSDSEGVLVWTWVDHKKSRTVSHELILLEINCPAEGFRFVQGRQFNHAGKGVDIGSTEWMHAPPHTIIGNVVEFTCMAATEPQAPAQYW